MYAEIKALAGKTKYGTYKNTTKYDKERLVWDQWIDIEPMTEEQRITLRKLCPILLQELHTKHPSRLCHFLVGRGTMTWQDVVVIEHLRQTDMERNSPFLKIIQTRGRQGFKAFVEALRSRHGAWQGYLAELLENKCDFEVLQDLLGVYKIICHDLIKVMSVGWSALPRALGLSMKEIEICRRQNKLLTNQVLHSLILWTGHRTDKSNLVSDLIRGLEAIKRFDIAGGVILLMNAIEVRSAQNTPRRPTTAGKKKRRASSARGTPSRSLSVPALQARLTAPNEMETIEKGHRKLRVKSGKLYSYGISPRNKSNAWERRRPSIIQLDYTTHPASDNMFVDHLAHR